ncbi:LysR family transcriptional regulator [Aeromonas schubertii]|uniref:transcriptional regulator GcvA n=2 Tax=Aeromonas TaxID=642 RepID=UPI00067F1011|nr:transcriptional regulator GcvA [Aeromonas schubertii]KUE80771.1 LysR family transcriptional regulator [Aeromonas schubertii]
MKTPIHLNALRAFEASARHLSFSAAAQELHVTPAAVGQLVRHLEEWVGTPLFIRQRSGKARLVLTDSAERALPDISAGFERLGLGVTKIRKGALAGVLTVAVSPAFAAKWLLPRIDRFQEVCPDTDVRLDTNLKPVDFAAQGIDIGVRYGLGHWPGLTATRLMDEEIYPVCSPQLLLDPHRLQQPADLLGETLIHDLSMDSHSGFPTWGSWLTQAGVKVESTIRGMKINNSAAVLQTAIEGHGIALARSVMASGDLASGRLVRLFKDIRFETPLAYYIVCRDGGGYAPRQAVFRDWLMQEARDHSPQVADSGADHRSVRAGKG